LTCGGFSLEETVHFGNFEFIVNYFGSLSLSPRRGDVGIIFISPTRSRASTPRQTMIGDSVEEFLTTPSGDGSFSLPSPRRRDTGASLTQITTTLWMENAPAAQAMTMTPRGWWRHGRKLASLLRNVTLTMGAVGAS
jgi:hypothetical protein